MGMCVILASEHCWRLGCNILLFWQPGWRNLKADILTGNVVY